MTPHVFALMTSSPSLPDVSFDGTAVTNAFDNDEDEDFLAKSVRNFWSSFPCPPPWNPTLLTEVNASKLGPQLTGVITDFLAGKCQLYGTHPGTRFGNDDGGGSPFHPNPESHLPESSSGLSQCDQTCQLAIGCSAVFMAIIIATVTLICFTRARKPHKMVATRPSRQQLQLSASTSETTNWGEFSNAQIQFDEDMIYPPFRHRGLPTPPSHCPHPSCDPKWNCSSCASCHPLMRMSPPGTTCNHHGYSAVYETIDDEDEETTPNSGCTDTTNRRPRYQNGIGHHTTSSLQCPNICHTFTPVTSPSGHLNDLSRCNEYRHAEAETGFNGDEVIRWPRYFELDHNYDRSMVNQFHPADRDKGLNSFRSPHPNTWGFHPIVAPSSFGSNPPVSADNPCAQLCATCVPNIVSMAPHGADNNITRPMNGYISDDKVLNVNPCSLNHSSSTSNSHDHNSSSTTDSGIGPSDNAHSDRTSNNIDDARLSEIRYCLKQSPSSCSTPPVQTSSPSSRYNLIQSQPLCQIPLPTRFSREESQLDSSPWLPSSPHRSSNCPSRRDSFGSPSRHWCPTCAQVPLLGGSVVNTHSRQNDHQMTDGLIAVSDNNWHRGDDYNVAIAHQNTIAHQNSTAHAKDISHSLNSTSGPRVDCLSDNNSEVEGLSSSTNDNPGNDDQNVDGNVRVLALHSAYFENATIV